MSPRKRDERSTAELRASLLAHAIRLIERAGPAALTMRGLAAEAGCAVGLPYKVFADRREIVGEILHSEFVRLDAASAELVARAGTGTVAGNLLWFAEILLDSPAVPLVHEVVGDDELARTVTARVHDTGTGPAGFEVAIASYLGAEKAAGRVGGRVDEHAFAFLIAGALHNLVMSGDAYPRPTRSQLEQVLAATAAALAPAG